MESFRLLQTTESYVYHQSNSLMLKRKRFRRNNSLVQRPPVAEYSACETRKNIYFDTILKRAFMFRWGPVPVCHIYPPTRIALIQWRHILNITVRDHILSVSRPSSVNGGSECKNRERSGLHYFRWEINILTVRICTNKNVLLKHDRIMTTP